MSKLVKPFRLPPMPSLSELVKLYKLRAIRQLSQNFLLDKNINDKIIRSAGIKKDSFVFEIGPGPGGLTRSAIEAGAKEIVVVEKDLRFMPGLQLLADAVTPTVNMKIFNGDAMTFPMGQHINRAYEVPWESDELPNANLIGNLPFNISTPLLFKLLLKVSDRNSVFACGRVPMTFLFQQEFGERMICPPGFKERSRVGIMTQAYCDVNIDFLIPNTAFVPPPKVNAACVTMIPLKKPRLKTKFEIVSKVVQAIFQFKNKNWIVGANTLYPKKYPEFLTRFNELCKVDQNKLPTDLDMIEIDQICSSYAQILDVFPELENYDHRISPHL
ncbi:unnamed protein product [Brachionus calyciflorus]|uniref:rRNA adenine N(6)-methyltransferase n=1 Tax=Brachionus calyciflorus TaxID=104777 RepID=A0A814E5C8_9BILA|nr:unnamed protein product [Brachionus calyciflorus]